MLQVAVGVEGVGGGLGALDLQFGLAVDAGVVGEVEGVGAGRPQLHRLGATRNSSPSCARSTALFPASSRTPSRSHFTRLTSHWFIRRSHVSEAACS